MPSEPRHKKPAEPKPRTGPKHSTRRADVARKVIAKAGPEGKAVAEVSKRVGKRGAQKAATSYRRGATVQSSAHGFSAMQVRSSRRILMVCFILSEFIVLLEPKSNQNVTTTQVLKQAGAVFFTFWILAVVSVTGAKPARWAAAFSGLILLGLMVNKRDALNNFFQSIAGQSTTPTTTVNAATLGTNS